MKILQVKVFIVFIYMLSSYNKILKPLLLTIFFVLSSNILFSQSYKSPSKKAVKYFEKARQEFLKDNINHTNVLFILTILLTFQ